MISEINWISQGVAFWVGWNLFLAVIPVVVGYLLLMGVENRIRLNLKVPWFYWSPIILLWLVFFPNTCYLLTEWRHFFGYLDANNLYILSRQDANAARELFQSAIFFFFFSGLGVITFVMALRPMERVLNYAKISILWWGPPLFFLSSLGVYLGLILRFNTWDLISHSDLILQASINALTQMPLNLIIVFFALFLWFLYEIINMGVDGFSVRIKKVFRKAS